MSTSAPLSTSYARVGASSSISPPPHLTRLVIWWVPGTHQITKRVRWGGGEMDDDAPTRAYDVDSGAEVDIPPQPREDRSRTGRYRADTGFGRYRADGGYGGFTGYGAWVDVLCSSGASPRRLHLPRGKARA